jgi:hypothetical protein
LQPGGPNSFDNYYLSIVARLKPGVSVERAQADVALGPRASPRPYVYHSHSQFAADRNWALTQVVAVEGDRPSLLGDARRELSQIAAVSVVRRQPDRTTGVCRRGGRARLRGRSRQLDSGARGNESRPVTGRQGLIVTPDGVR